MLWNVNAIFQGLMQNFASAAGERRNPIFGGRSGIELLIFADLP